MWVFWPKSSFFIINWERLWNDSIIWKRNSFCQDLITKYLHRNINQQLTKETWEENSQWESIPSKGGKGNYIMKWSTQKRKYSKRIQYLLLDQVLPKCWGICDFVTQQMTPQMNNNGSESEPAPLESNEDTELDDTQPENIQDSESNLTAIDTAPLSKKQLYWARCHFLSHLPTDVYDSLKMMLNLIRKRY